MILLLAAALSSWTVPLPEGYDSTVAPSLVACTSEPTRVHAEMHLTKVHTMDEKKETISIEGYLRLRWNDQRLAAPHITSGKDLIHRCPVLLRVRVDIAARVEFQTKRLDHAFLHRMHEPHGEKHDGFRFISPPRPCTKLSERSHEGEGEEGEPQPKKTNLKGETERGQGQG